MYVKITTLMLSVLLTTSLSYDKDLQPPHSSRMVSPNENHYGFQYHASSSSLARPLSQPSANNGNPFQVPKNWASDNASPLSLRPSLPREDFASLNPEISDEVKWKEVAWQAWEEKYGLKPEEISAWIEDKKRSYDGVLELFRIYRATENEANTPQLKQLRDQFPAILISHHDTAEFKGTLMGYLENEIAMSPDYTSYGNKLIFNSLVTLSEDELSAWLAEIMKYPILGKLYITRLNIPSFEHARRYRYEDYPIERFSKIIINAQLHMESSSELTSQLAGIFLNPKSNINEVDLKNYLYYLQLDSALLFDTYRKIRKRINANDPRYIELKPTINGYFSSPEKIQIMWDKIRADQESSEIKKRFSFKTINTWMRCLQNSGYITYSKADKVLLLDIDRLFGTIQDLPYIEVRKRIGDFFSTPEYISKMWQEIKFSQTPNLVTFWVKKLEKSEDGINWLHTRQKDGKLTAENIFNYNLEIAKNRTLRNNYLTLEKIGTGILQRHQEIAPPLSAAPVPAQNPAARENLQQNADTDLDAAIKASEASYKEEQQQNADAGLNAAIKASEASYKEEQRRIAAALERDRASASSSAPQQAPVSQEKQIKDGDNLTNASIIVGKYLKQIAEEKNLSKSTFPSFEDIWARIPQEECNFTEVTAYAAYKSMMEGETYPQNWNAFRLSFNKNKNR